MKKFLSILMVLAMILAMSTTAFAAEDETFTLTITGTEGHAYEIYQIYTGDIEYEGTETVLTHVKYGANHYPVDSRPGVDVPLDELKTLMSAQKPAEILDSSVKGDPIATIPVGEETSATVSNLAPGYYMIVDATIDLPDGQTRSPIMLQMLENVTIASKHASITSEKKVDDKKDSTHEEDSEDWQDVADYDFGDDVPFRLTVTLPETFNSYENYTLTFHDEKAAGLGNPENMEVYILKADGTKITVNEGNPGYQVLPCTSDKCEFGGCSFTIEVGDVKLLYGDKTFTKDDIIVVEYTAELLDTANVGKDGNENGMYVCHPDGHTPKDYVTVLTYELKVNKIDGATKEALAGAGFTLYKWIADAKDGVGDWAVVGVKAAGDDITSFTWSGVDGGLYKLVESTRPNAYNAIGDIEFTLDSTHKTVWVKTENASNSAFLDLIAKDMNGTPIFADQDANGVEDGKLEGVVENYKGAILPETGAEGTFMLITFGTILVVVAAVFMITRKKMSIYED